MKKEQVLRKVQMFAKRNSSTILTAVGVIGVVGTAVTAVKATPKAVRLLEEAKKEKGDKLTTLETIKVAGPAYIPSIVTGTATIACIVGANVLNKKQQASVMSAYALLDNSYKEYKKKVDDLYGKEVDMHIKKEIAKDKFTGDVDISEKEEDEELFYDEFSQEYFLSTPLKVKEAEYRVNRTLRTRDYVSVNEYYSYLGMQPIQGGDDLGWSNGGNVARYWQEWIDFTHEKCELEDGLEVTIVVMQGEPYLGYEDYI